MSSSELHMTSVVRYCSIGRSRPCVMYVLKLNIKHP